MSQLYALFIISKSGGLVFKHTWREFPHLTDNKYLSLASTFFSLQAIVGAISPTEDKTSHINKFECATFQCTCFKSATGLLIFAFADKKLNSLSEFLISVYKLYGSYVLQNPFQSFEQPLRQSSEKFVTKVIGLGDNLK